MPWPITYNDVLDAERRLRPYLAPTLLRSYPLLDEALGMHVLVKHENHQPTSAFKVRNGLAVISSLSDEQRRRGVVAASSGNYGQGLAWAGMKLGVKVTICMATTVSDEKKQAVRSFGAELVVEGRHYDEANEVAARLVAQRGLVPVHGVNHPQCPMGAGTITLEVLEQAAAMGEKIDTMLLAIGGGSQAVGGMTVLRERAPGVPVIGVQSEKASTQQTSWVARTPTPQGPPPTTVAEGIATAATYPLTFDALCEGLSDFVLVSDADMAAAMRLLLRTARTLSEPAGAAGVAAAAKLRAKLAGQTVAVVISGANVSMPLLRSVMDEAI